MSIMKCRLYSIDFYPGGYGGLRAASPGLPGPFFSSAPPSVVPDALRKQFTDAGQGHVFDFIDRGIATPDEARCKKLGSDSPHTA